MLSNAEVALAAMGICFNVSATGYMIPMGLGTAINARVASALGAGDAQGAQHTYHTSALVGMVVGVLLCAITITGRHHIAAAFCSDAAVVSLVAQVLPLVGCNMLGEGLNTVMQAVLRASGRQMFGATLNLLGYWGMGVPLALLLGFKMGMGVSGFWAAIALSSLAQGLLLAAFVSRWDWQLEVQRAQENVRKGVRLASAH